MAEVKQLQRFFTKASEFPKDEIEERGKWEVFVLTQSLDWWVPVDWIASDFKEKGKLQRNVEAFSLAEDNMPF